jgi:hypothetical protein
MSISRRRRNPANKVENRVLSFAAHKTLKNTLSMKIRLPLPRQPVIVALFR